MLAIPVAITSVRVAARKVPACANASLLAIASPNQSVGKPSSSIVDAAARSSSAARSPSALCQTPTRPRRRRSAARSRSGGALTCPLRVPRAARGRTTNRTTIPRRAPRRRTLRGVAPAGRDMRSRPTRTRRSRAHPLDAERRVTLVQLRGRKGASPRWSGRGCRPTVRCACRECGRDARRSPDPRR